MTSEAGKSSASTSIDSMSKPSSARDNAVSSDKGKARRKSRQSARLERVTHVSRLLRMTSRSYGRRTRSPGAIMRTEWLSIIGPELAAITQPERFNNGRLTLLVEKFPCTRSATYVGSDHHADQHIFRKKHRQETCLSAGNPDRSTDAPEVVSAPIPRNFRRRTGEAGRTCRRSTIT